MRFERLSENKIRITLNHDDLIKKDIDFHSFMTDSIESQDLFFDCLKKAEKEIGFITKDYRLRIEALAMPSSGDFVLIVTRSLPEYFDNNSKKKLHIKRKKIDLNTTQAIYSFSNIDDYFAFISFLKRNNFEFTNLADYIMLYEYKNKYFLVLNNINLSYPNLKNLLYCITEFAYFISNSNVLISKLAENGTLIMQQ